MSAVTRRVSLNQQPTFGSGGVHLGYITYLLEGTEMRDGRTVRCHIAGRALFDRGDRKAHRAAGAEAQRAAWDAARAWVRELGEPTTQDGVLESSGVIKA